MTAEQRPNPSVRAPEFDIELRQFGVPGRIFSAAEWREERRKKNAWPRWRRWLFAMFNGWPYGDGKDER